MDRIDGIPPAIAIDQTNPVRTSRSTVGTMTELNDHLKLLFARAAQLYCRDCGKPVRRDTRREHLRRRAARARGGRRSAHLVVLSDAGADELRRRKCASCWRRRATRAFIEQRPGEAGDTLRRGPGPAARWATPNARASMEALEAALRVRPRTRRTLHVWTTAIRRRRAQRWRYSSALHCADCDISYRDPVPSLFSFNSPLGACETCRGFGRVIGVDYDLVIPDEAKTLAGGAVKPWQTPSYKECQDDLVKFAQQAPASRSTRPGAT